MQRENLIARVFRALSGKSQKQTAEEMGVDPSLVARVELGEVAPDRKYLEALGRTAGHTAEDGEEILRFYDTLRQPRRRAGQGAEALTEGLAKEMEAVVSRTYLRLRKLQLPPPGPEDRVRALDQFAKLRNLPEEQRWAVVHAGLEFANWALCERICTEALRKATAGRHGEAAFWLRTAEQIAEEVPGPEPWRRRVQGYAQAHRAQILKLAGDPETAEEALQEARRLWEAGEDPEGLLSWPGGSAGGG
jgi:transcriptional regulator with XRE-family HTH domain